MKRIVTHCREIHLLRVIAYGLIFAVFYEAGTAFFRFGLGMETTKTTASWLGPLLLGIRIHHLYVGVVIGVIGAIFRPISAIRNLLYSSAIMLITSDLAHHFIVLKLAIGSCEFDLFYP